MNKIVNMFNTFKGKDKGHFGHHYGTWKHLQFSTK
jgi:hypothetical protein